MDEAVQGDQFGTRVAMNDDYAAISAPHGLPGRVFSYELPDPLIASNGVSSFCFGHGGVGDGCGVCA